MATSVNSRLAGLGLNATTSELNTYTEPTTTLADERTRTKFNVRELTYYLDGGKEKTELTEKIMLTVERDPYFYNDDMYDLTLKETRELAVKRIAAISRYVQQAKTEQEIQQTLSIVGLSDPGSYTRIGVHFGLFLSSIRGSGTSDQLSYWVSKGAGTFEHMYGCFAMTELGHGSNVAGLETTATYDGDSDEFIIHTPNEAATKWWIGGAAHSATHTVCFARLIVNGKDYGVKNFVVPLRDTTDHSLKPGISLGDIGKKMGRDAIDNGWIKFTHVRVPRQFMLMKYTKVDSKGNVTQPPLAQLAYGALIGGRVSMAADSFQWSKRFLTIAIRYAAARRQFASTEGASETKILDYTYHQRRLLPRLAYAYAMKAGADELYELYYSAMRTLDTVDQKDKVALGRAIEDVKELFQVSAGLKAFSTWGTSDIIDECRQACGGHGYSGYNGFGQGFNDWAVQCTWEGDNNVLTLSAGRALIQSGLALKKGKTPGSALIYLTRSDELKGKTLGSRDIRSPQVLLEGWQVVSSQAINNAVDQYIELTQKKGYGQVQAFEELSQQRFEIARIHTRLYLIQSFYDRIESQASGAIKKVLLDVAGLFGLWSLETEGSLFLKYGFINADNLDQITSHVNDYCRLVRDQAIGLTDAFNLSDFFINAPIGNYDGDVYKNYFDKVIRRNPPRDDKAPYHEKLIAPFLNRKEEPEHDLEELYPEED